MHQHTTSVYISIQPQITWPLDSGVHLMPFLDSLHSSMPDCDCHNSNCNRTSQTSGGTCHRHSQFFTDFCTNYVC